MMKNLLKKGLLVVMLCFAMVAKASDKDDNIKVSVIDSKLIDLVLRNFDGELVISVKDLNGQVLYSESYKGSKFSKKYDIETLPAGDYFFEIEGYTKIKLMPFNVTSKEVKFNNEIEVVYFKPIVRRDNDLIFISKIALKNESLTISLIDDSENVLYNETIAGTATLGKVLNVKELKKGSYKLVLSSDNRFFMDEIKIEK